MEGKTVIVTGANSGLGLETARGLLARGAEVVMVCRSRDKAEAARADIVKTAGRDTAHIVLCDLSVLADIRRAAAEMLQRFPKIHVLVNNAGLMNTERHETVDGLELTFAVNHLAPMLLTHLLRDRLVASAPARVVTVASGAHVLGRVNFDDLQSRRFYTQFVVYGHTKLMNILFTRELARRLAGTGVTATCMHPGFVNTNFGPQKGLMRLMQPLSRPFGQTPEQGADTIVWLASSPEAAHLTGECYAKRKVARTSRRARDMKVARELWEVSEALAGIAPGAPSA